jgi:hypothetical protein
MELVRSSVSIASGAARHWPPPRSAIANVVFRNVTESMKGETEPLVDRAVLQGRRVADTLYLLVVKANSAVLEEWEERRREYIFLLGYLSAEMSAEITKNRVQVLRLVLLVFLKSVILLDASIAQLVTHRLSNQSVLFRDAAGKMTEQLEMATNMSTWFNQLASAVGTAEINLEELRKSLQSAVEEQIAIWEKLALVTTEDLFGRSEGAKAALDQCFLLCEPKSGDRKLVEVSMNTAGEITGSYIDGDNACHHFVYDANGTPTGKPNPVDLPVRRP